MVEKFMNCFNNGAERRLGRMVMDSTGYHVTLRSRGSFVAASQIRSYILPAI